MVVLRIKTKDGQERMQCESSCRLGEVRQIIAAQFSVPIEQQALSRSVKTGPVPRKGAPFVAADDSSQLAALGVTNGDILFLDYQLERENHEKYVDRDPFKTLAKEGELRREIGASCTLTNFLIHRATKEYVLGSPPEPHAKFVQIDQRATQGLMNFMIAVGFGCKRFCHLYGRWAENEAGEGGVEVHAIYEPAQESTPDEIVLLSNEDGDARAARVAAMLGLTLVGVCVAHPAREYAFSVNEILLASHMHARAVAADADKAMRFITMDCRPVLATEEGIEGVATVECYQMTDQVVELASREGGCPFKQAKTDPRVAKTTADDLTFVVEKKEVRKAAYEHFIARVHSVGALASFLSSGFTIENRPTEPQARAYCVRDTSCC